MKSKSPFRLRLCLATVLILVLGMILYSGPLGAQGFRPPRSGAPSIPPPNIPQPPPPPGIGNPNPGNPRMPNFPEPPRFEKVWTCSGCGAELGRGQIMPALEKCPHCGVRFINGTNPIGSQPPINNPGPPNFNPPTGPQWNPPVAGSPVDSSPSVNTTASSPPSGLATVVGIAVILGIGIVAAVGIAVVVVLIMWLCKSPARAVRRRRAY
jgi:hypothetical protein